MTQLSERPPGSLTETPWLTDRPPRHAASRAGIPMRVVVVAVLAAAVAGGAAGGVAGSLTARTTATTAEPTPAISVPSQTAPEDLPAVIARVSKSVVDIEATTTTTEQGEAAVEHAAGTGFVYDPVGLIATNAHVVGTARRVSVTLADGSRLQGDVLGRDTAHDLAVVRIDKHHLLALQRGSSAKVRVGDFVVAAGNALALEGSPTITVGIVSALDRTITTSTGTELSGLIQTDAAISSGDSGGPLLTPSGDVIGINTAGAASTEGVVVANIGFAIPINQAMPVLRRLSR